MPDKNEIPEEIIQEVQSYVVGYMKREKPYLLLMDEEILRFKNERVNGVINFSVRIFEGVEQDMVIELLPKSESVKYTFKKS